MDWTPAHHHRVTVGCELALELLARMHEVPEVANSVEETLASICTEPLWWAMSTNTAFSDLVLLFK